ncbi:MAG: hypothetical protein ABJE95_12575 [Byssovorax sp.]
MSLAPPPPPPKNPTSRQSALLLLSGGLLMVSGVATTLGSHGAILGPITLGLASLIIALALFVRQSWPAAQAVNSALNATLAGRLVEAEERFIAAHAQFKLGYIRRVIAVNRAWIALRRGDLERAVALATEAVNRPLGWLTRATERGNILDARGIRAVALASLGDRVAAEADVAAIGASELALPQALARAELARALLLEQEGDRGALAAHLEANRRLLLEHTHPRERAIVRAYLRMLETKASSVYRHGASRDEVASEEPLLSDWIAKLAPAAASFVGAEKPRSTTPLESTPEAPNQPAAAAAAQARFHLKPVGKLGRILAIYAALTVMFLGIWQLLAPTPRPHHGSVDSNPGTTVLVYSIVLVAVFLGALALLVRRRKIKDAQLRAAIVTLARGDEATAMASFRALTSGPPLVAAQALLMLATETERTGDLSGAQALCEQGIAASAKVPITASMFLLPGLFAEHALLLAAQGESAQATAEIALLEQRHPAYALLDAARFRVALLDKARRGDFVGAARVAEKSADLPLTVRDELLADLVRVLADPESNASAETERLRKELHRDTVSAAWVEKVAPRVAAAFAAGHAMTCMDEMRADEEAERAAEAEAEEERERAKGWV